MDSTHEVEDELDALDNRRHQRTFLRKQAADDRDLVEVTTGVVGATYNLKVRTSNCCAPLVGM